jgi:hypothetical protein
VLESVDDSAEGDIVEAAVLSWMDSEVVILLTSVDGAVLVTDISTVFASEDS